MKRTVIGVVVGVLVAVCGAGTADAAPAFAPPAADACGGTGYAPPGAVWGPVSQSNCGLAGHPGFTKVYSYTSQSGASPIHASAKHYTNAGGLNPGPEKWTEFGFGTSGKSGPLPWGNALAMPAMKFKSMNVLGAIVDWT